MNGRPQCMPDNGAKQADPQSNDASLIPTLFVDMHARCLLFFCYWKMIRFGKVYVDLLGAIASDTLVLYR
jgi:hypothetical protein